VNDEQRSELRRKTCRDARESFWSRYDKDSYECPICGVADARFDVHHRNGDWLDQRSLNLYAVCATCHRREHSRRAREERLTRMREEFEAIADGGERQ